MLEENVTGVNRRDFLKLVTASALGAMALTSCSKAPSLKAPNSKNPSQENSSPNNQKKPALEVIVGRDVQAVSNDPADYTPASYFMIPGGTMESITNSQRYYLKLIFEKDIKLGAALTTTITSGDLMLMMVTANEEKGERSNIYHLDTGGYTGYLMRASNQQMDIHFSLSGNDRTAYHATLPLLSELGGKAAILTLDERPKPVFDEYELVDKDFFHPSEIPAFLRVQEKEKTVYMLHQK